MIYLPPPQPVINTDIRISGDVEIHPTASLAPGVILQAAPNSKISIGADVCIGMGVILNAGQGSITIESGATLGSGVLIIGESKIGNNACIGTATTIFQVSVAPMTVISPGSIVGDISRQISTETNTNNGKVQTLDDSVGENDRKSHPNSTSLNDDNAENNGAKSTSKAHQADVNSSTSPSEKTAESSTDTVGEQNQDEIDKKQDFVVGQTYINQLLVTLFPHKKDFNSNDTNTKSGSQ